MAYRDEHEALRARLEATEQRLRVAENELADARRELEKPLEPSSAPPSSRRVGFPQTARHGLQYGRMAAALGGTVLSLLGIASLLWNLPGADGVGDIAATLAAAIAFCLAPGALLLYFSARTRPRRSRVASDAAVEVPRAGMTNVDVDVHDASDELEDVERPELRARTR